ncbi:hypothetical protein [Chachezhania antarctica]|uniref:DUF7742 family protein n=1 Tax=Chachezhania antarctica TaxID=2340860 RepID=UPI000EB43F01|nr:hypothetical protein [Chachezhania antarctica]|tara:strand:- start:5448 stop:5750 length:303 start_codon:yes stop_codon:yes gene_type:complete
MRPILHGDVSCAARALYAVPEDRRMPLGTRLIREAEEADRFVNRFGKLHPFWGNGSLMAAARSHVLVDEPGFDDIDYCACFELVLQVLADHLSRTRGRAG